MTSALGTKKKPNVLMRYVGKITLVEEEKKTPPKKMRGWIIPKLV